MPERNFGPARFGRSSREAEIHRARLETIKAFLIESQVPPEEEAILPSVSRHGVPRQVWIFGGPIVWAALATAAICGGGEKNGGGGQENGGGSQPPPVTRQDEEGFRLPFANGEPWHLTSGPHYDPRSKNRVRYALDFAPKKVIHCPGGSPNEEAHVVAVYDGEVVIVGDEDDPSDKNHSVVEIEHVLPDGRKVRSGYMHLDNIPVEEGQQVKKGEVLGNPSCEFPPGGGTSGVHLHAYAEDENGKPISIDGIVLSGWETVADEPNYDGWMRKKGEVTRKADQRRCGPDEASIINICGGERNDLMVGQVLGEATTATPSPTVTLGPTATAENKPTEYLQLWIGGKAPDFELPAIDGQMVRLSDYRGKPVIIFYYGYNCPPCNSDLGKMAEMAIRYQDYGLVVLTIASGEYDARVISDKISPVLVEDINQPTFDRLYQVSLSGVPTSFFINQQGVLVGVKSGMSRQQELEIAVQAIISGRSFEEVIATATAEASVRIELPATVENITDLIRKGHQGITITEEQSPKYHYGPEDIIWSLGNCNGRDPLVLKFPPSLGLEDMIIGSEDPAYLPLRLDECGNVGDAIKEWYQITGRGEFLEANRLMRDFHKALYEQIVAENPNLDYADWPTQKNWYYKFD